MSEATTRRREPQARSPRAKVASRAQAARIAAPRLWLIAAVATLCALGIVMVYSASSIKSLTAGANAQGELFSQLIFAVGGLIVAILVAKLFDYREILEKSAYFVGFSLVLLICVRLLGVASHGATRWLTVAGVSIQPSELAKVCVIGCAAWLLATTRKGKRLADRTFIVQGFLCLFTMVMVLVQPDKGTVMVMAIALWVMIIADGAPPKPMCGIAIAFVIAYVLFSMRDEYSRQRILSVIDPFADEYGDGYQNVHGFFAFASGGLLGRGIGNGVQKYAYLPEAQNDFILPVVGEEMGLLGVLLVFSCFGVIAWAGSRIAREANDAQGRLLVMGCLGLLLGQAILNFAGVLGVAPLTGKNVPFLSAGGSSMLASMLIVGLMVNVSLHTTLPETEHDRRRRSLKVAEDPAPSRSRRASKPERAPVGEGVYAAYPALKLVPGGNASAPREATRVRSGAVTPKRRAPRSAGSAPRPSMTLVGEPDRAREYATSRRRGA